MRLQFLQATHLVGAPGHKAKDYSVGVHEVASAVLKANHAKIDRYIKAGLVVEGEKIKKAVSLETVQERQIRLAERLGLDVSDAKAKLAQSKTVEVEPAAEEVEESEIDEQDAEPSEESEESEEPVSEEETAPKSSKKRRK